MTALSLIFTLAAIGVSEVVYLIETRLAHEKPVCPIGGESCTIVLRSKYSRFFFVPNDFLGLLFYIATGSLAAFLVVGVEPVLFWQVTLCMLVGGGVLFSLVLVYLQARVIKQWCFWCLLSSATTWLMALILVLNPNL